MHSDTGLMLIDIQKGLDELDYYGGNRNNPHAEENAARLLLFFRENNLPVYHVRHSSQNLESPLHSSKPGFAIKTIVAPLSTEPLFTKNVNSAFIGTHLEQQLRKDSIETLIIVGLTTNHCISTSVRMAANLGFDTILVSDATAAFDMRGINGQIFGAELMHQTALASLKDEFATVLQTDVILTTLQKNLS